jgi:transposase-like protein
MVVKLGMNDVTRRPRSTATERAQWVQRYLESGVAPREFAAQHGLKYSTLQRWVTQAPAATPTFTEVKLPPLLPTVGWTAEVVRPGGATLRLTNAVSATLIEQLLRAC